MLETIEPGEQMLATRKSQTTGLKLGQVRAMLLTTAVDWLRGRFGPLRRDRLLAAIALALAGGRASPSIRTGSGSLPGTTGGSRARAWR
jgi:hypothetical protein